MWYSKKTSALWACVEVLDEKAPTRCCFPRESDRKSDLSRLTVCVFGTFFPFLLLESKTISCSTRRHLYGCKNLCGRLAVFHKRVRIK